MSNIHPLSASRVLVMTAVEAERDAVLRGLNGDSRFDVKIAGVGPALAAARTASALAAGEYALVVSAGIGGGFPGRVGIGDIVVSTDIVAADLGAETPDGFVSLDELGFGSSRIPVAQAAGQRLLTALQESTLTACAGTVLTVSTVTGTAHRAEELFARIPEAAAEAMEGFGVAAAARDREVPVLELRAISNLVGPRDRSLWRIGDALSSLEKASHFLEVLTS